MKRLLCLIGYHDYGPDRWRWVEPAISYYWFNRCYRCGKIKILRRSDTPPTHFIKTPDGVLKEVLNGATDHASTS